MSNFNSINNGGVPYYFPADIAKEGQQYARFSNWLKTRVNDNGKKVPVKWYDQGRVMNVNGLTPFIRGMVGHFTTDENDELIPSSDVVSRDWQGSPADVTDGGLAFYTLEDQFFCQEGQFKGVFGLRDGNGNVYTSVNIVFEILGNDLRMGETTKYYSSKLDKMVKEFNVRTDQVIDEARNTYKKEVQNTRDALNAKDAEVEATRAEQRILGNQLDTYKDQIEKNQIVRRSEFITNSEALIASINDKLSKISTNPEAFDTLDELKAKYPTGKAGIFFIGQTKHLYIYTLNAWKDIGELPTAGLTNEQTKILDNSIYNQLFIYDKSQLVAPYTDLDLYPANTIVCLAVETSSIVHTPELKGKDFNSGFTVMTYGPTDTNHGTPKDGITQLLIDAHGKLFWRIRWLGNYTNWKSEYEARNRFFFAMSQLKPPYDNLNTFPANESAVYAIDASNIKNTPEDNNAFTVKTWGINDNDSQSGTVQLVNSRNGSMYIRTSWGEKPDFTKWAQIKVGTSEENEFDYAKPSLSMFGKFGVIGDSYASGVLEDYSHFKKDVIASMTPAMIDNLSWPKMLARKWGTSALHLSKGGLSTRTWLTDDQGLEKLNNSDPQDIYYLCLGINDYYGLGDSYLGIESDMESGADSFYGNYAKIIKAIQKKASLAKIIMFGLAITPGDKSERQKRFSDAQEKIAKHFGIPFISEMDDDLFSSDYYVKNMGSGHPSSYLYGAMAEAFERLIQKAVYRNRDYFYNYGWNGQI